MYPQGSGLMYVYYLKSFYYLLFFIYHDWVAWGLIHVYQLECNYVAAQLNSYMYVRLQRSRLGIWCPIRHRQLGEMTMPAKLQWEVPGTQSDNLLLDPSLYISQCS